MLAPEVGVGVVSDPKVGFGLGIGGKCRAVRNWGVGLGVLQRAGGGTCEYKEAIRQGESVDMRKAADMVSACLQAAPVFKVLCCGVQDTDIQGGRHTF